MSTSANSSAEWCEPKRRASARRIARKSDGVRRCAASAAASASIATRASMTDATDTRRSTTSQSSAMLVEITKTPEPWRLSSTPFPASSRMASRSVECPTPISSARVVSPGRLWPKGHSTARMRPSRISAACVASRPCCTAGVMQALRSLCLSASLFCTSDKWCLRCSLHMTEQMASSPLIVQRQRTLAYSSSFSLRAPQGCSS